ncbi:MAG TPA: hypothetical protein PLQ35_01280 [bacterium]|nr:hypothetical protein [bacterium]HQL60904.1 hypothetical protein [bacterium]
MEEVRYYRQSPAAIRAAQFGLDHSASRSRNPHPPAFLRKDLAGFVVFPRSGLLVKGDRHG